MRLDGINAPELFRPKCDAERIAARASRDALVQIVGERVVLRDIRHDKYAGRVVAKAFSLDGRNLAEHLVITGFAVDEVAAKPWCSKS